jgi:hypothetical protein
MLRYAHVSKETLEGDPHTLAVNQKGRTLFSVHKGPKKSVLRRRLPRPTLPRALRKQACLWRCRRGAEIRTRVKRDLQTDLLRSKRDQRKCQTRPSIEVKEAYKL